MNKEELAKEQGRIVFDTALPQDFWQAFYDEFRVSPADLGIVWDYTDSKYIGQAYGLDPTARVLLEIFRLRNKFV